jgi:hypothetical protein
MRLNISKNPNIVAQDPVTFAPIELDEYARDLGER